MQSEGSACKWPMKRMMHMICGLEIHNKCIHGTEERTYFPHLILYFMHPVTWTLTIDGFCHNKSLMWPMIFFSHCKRCLPQSDVVLLRSTWDFTPVYVCLGRLPCNITLGVFWYKFLFLMLRGEAQTLKGKGKPTYFEGL